MNCILAEVVGKVLSGLTIGFGIGVGMRIMKGRDKKLEMLASQLCSITRLHEQLDDIKKKMERA